MPNGGLDCCATCWFNRRNRGQTDHLRADMSVAPYCEIRDMAIEAPSSTFCGNHPLHRPRRDPIPIGPILRHYELSLLDTWTNRRVIWKLSPDTEEIRLHLLILLQDVLKGFGVDFFPRRGQIWSSLSYINWQRSESRGRCRPWSASRSTVLSIWTLPQKKRLRSSGQSNEAGTIADADGLAQYLGIGGDRT